MPTKIPNLEELDKSQSGNLVGSSLVWTCLTLPNLGFLWVFFKYPNISKNGNPLFFLWTRQIAKLWTCGGWLTFSQKNKAKEDGYSEVARLPLTGGQKPIMKI